MATEDRWRILSPYLDEVLDITDVRARAAWLLSLRNRHPTLADELEAMLDEHAALVQARFLDQSVALPVKTLAGGTFGAYTLVSLLGEGGMGSVWLAERSDGRFDRRAAIKLLNLALVGRGEERFKREGRILARLAEPHIAQLLDAGVTDAGRPYLVLEYVDGKPIDRFCDDRGLDVEARVRLFLQVVEAVAYAHTNLIVHRDIKPSNVLVSGDGHVKLLDFGIAKLLEDEGRTGGATLLTREGGSALTPEYAAPEQLTNAPITTATDGYTLGLLLYVLLTGQHPAGHARGSPADVMRAIVDTEPRRPSDVVATGRSGTESLIANASSRAVTPDKLRRLLRGDLDTIVAKALKKNPAERYTSASALANDLRRYLQHEPISARPDTIAYRTAKFVRRNTLSVAVAILVVAALSAALIVTNRERVIAERRFGELRQLSRKVFELDMSIRSLPGSTEARRRLVSTSLEYLEGLDNDVHGDLDLAQEMADAYRRVAVIQGVPTELNLGDFAAAERSLKKAEEFAEMVLTSRPHDKRALERSATIAHDRMILAESERRRQDAAGYAHKATDRVDALLNTGQAAESERSTAAWVYSDVALAYANIHLYDLSARAARRQLELARTLPKDQDKLSFGLSVLANALRFQGDLDGALKTIQQARSTAELAIYPNPTTRMLDFYGVLLREGLILGDEAGVSLDRPADAVEPLQKAFDLTDAVARQDAHDSVSRGRAGTSARELGNVLRGSNPQRALVMYDLAIGRLREIPHNVKARRDEALTLAESSYALHRLHRTGEARQRIDAAIKILGETKDLPTDRIALDSPGYSVLRAQAHLVDEEGEPQQALELSEGLLEKVMRSNPDPQNDLRDAAALSQLYGDVIAFSAHVGGSQTAERTSERNLDLWRQWERRLPGNPFVLRKLNHR